MTWNKCWGPHWPVATAARVSPVRDLAWRGPLGCWSWWALRRPHRWADGGPVTGKGRARNGVQAACFLVSLALGSFPPLPGPQFLHL